MKGKIIGILVVMLLIGTVVPAGGTMNIKNGETKIMTPEMISSDIVWSDNFDSYVLGETLGDNPEEDGGWEIYDDGVNNPPCTGGEVVDYFYRSPPHSLEIYGSRDILHPFTGLNNGNVTCSLWSYVGNEVNYGAVTVFGSYHKQGANIDPITPVAVQFDNVAGVIFDVYYGKNLPIITDQWVEIRLELDLEEDWYECYYNNELLLDGIWTVTTHGEAYRNLGFLDFFLGTNSVFFDDITVEWESTGLEPDLDGEGNFNWNVQPESIITDSFTLENNGDPDSWLEWKIEEYPDFGTWYCDPERGLLKPEDGPITVEVRVKAPERKNKEFTGDLKIGVVGNPDDEVVIPVTLTTPKNSDSINTDGSVLWDNGMHYQCYYPYDRGALFATQWAPEFPFDCIIADDFQFEQTTDITGINWIGGYFNPAEDKDYDWNISFYNDRGDGLAPGEKIYENIYSNEEVHETYIEYYDSSIPQQDAYVFSYWVDLDEFITFNSGEKYWISIQGLGPFPPQTGWGSHSPNVYQPFVIISNFFEIFDWTYVDFLPQKYDTCFQLTGEGDEPDPDLEGGGNLQFEDVPAGSTVNGTVIIRNTGDTGSMLEWEVQSVPEDWGDNWKVRWSWNSMSNISELEGGFVGATASEEIFVEVQAPNEKNANFTGEIVLVNSDNSEDTVTINVVCKTPKDKHLYFISIFERFLEQHPRIALLIEHIL